tara:strand:- start:240 stop:812 length:573 start_codon:yes stop_codon:yes gene_type:complete
MRLIVALTGATGVVLGVRLLQALKDIGDMETHLIVSKWGQQTLEHETTVTLTGLRELASHTYSPGDMTAALSSGSFGIDGMVIVPCSMRTLAAVTYGYGDNLIHRAADVTLKEQRPLVVVPRETPLSATHLENMLRLARAGVTILPPMPAFYNHPATVEEIVDHVVGRILDQLGITTSLSVRWSGEMKRS